MSVLHKELDSHRDWSFSRISDGRCARALLKKEGRDFIMTGYWKVYSNPEKARMIFHEYDRAKVCAVNEYLDGKNIREIALNQRKWRNL